MKKIFTLFLSFFIFLSIFSFVFVVNIENVKSTIIYNETFDNDDDNSYASEGTWFETGTVSPTAGHYEYFLTQSSYVYSAPLGYKTRMGGVPSVSDTWEGGCWNFSIPNLELSDFSIKMKYITQGVASSPKATMELRTITNSIGTISVTAGNGVDNGVLVAFGKTVTAWINKWYEISVHMNSSTVGWLTVYNVTDSYLSLSETVAFSSSFSDLAYANFTGSSTGTHTYLYLDDLEINTFTQSSQYGNLEAYPSIGSIDRYNYLDIDYQCIEKKYDIAIDTTIKGVDLQVGTTQYNDDHNLNNYQLYVNGVYCGGPDYFFPNDVSGYTLRWIFDLTLVNEKPVFEFFHNALVVATNFWYLYDGYPNSMLDLDIPYPDNLIQYKWGNIFPDGVYSNNYFINYDLAMKFYYVNLIIPEGEIGFNDSIVLIDDNGYYPSNETYRFSCYASTLIPQTYFYAYLENVSLNVQDYPFLMFNSHEYFQFTPTELGNYSFTIRRNNVNVTYFNMTVTQGERGYLYTYPNPSKANELYTIAYAYYDTEGDNGLISISLNPTSIINTTPIFANSSGTFTSVGIANIYYISLYTLIGNEYALSKQHIHFVDIATYGLPELDIAHDTLIVGETQVFSVIQELFEHTTLKLNGVIIASNIHGENVFQLSYVMEYGGLYNASLHDMYSDILLDYELFTVTGESYEPPVFGIEADTFKIIEGLIIVILLMFIPFGLSIMGANVGTTIYLLFLFIGCVIATLLGLFPYFIPASIIVCEILGIIVLKFWR